MRRFLQFIGTMVFFCAWPAFWVYYKRGHGRTRIVLVRGDKVLVMRQWIGPGRWQLPGGGLHKGEDVLEGASRELGEETGIQLDAGKLRRAGRATYRTYGLTYEYDVLAAGLDPPEVRIQRIEISEATWLRPEELTAQNSAPDTLAAIRLVRKNTSLLQ